MYKQLNSLENQENISKNDLFSILKENAKAISINDLMLATAQLHADGEFVPESYRVGYEEIYIKFFIMRIKDIKEDKNNYDGNLDKEELLDSINLLKYQLNEFFKENNIDLNDIKDISDSNIIDIVSNINNVGDYKFLKIYAIISLYTTYILNEPIHPVGTPFPGSLKVTEENGVFYCPVKENNIDNPKAVCKFCIAEQSEF